VTGTPRACSDRAIASPPIPAPTIATDPSIPGFWHAHRAGSPLCFV
jgi:hypothetical protein